MRDFCAVGGAALLGAAAAAIVAASALAAAVTLRLRSLPLSLLTVSVVAFAEIIGLTLVLSAVGWLSRSGLFVGSTGLLLASIAIWLQTGRPPLPRPQSGAIRELRRPVLTSLGVTVGFALAYVVALIVGTPPNTWDSLVYHLARAALWGQTGHVGYISNAYDGRLNGNPPNAELALTYVLDVTRNERFAAFVQLAAALSCGLGIFVLARRLHIERGAAVFGALLFLTLPIVLLQASTTQNDLVAAAMLIAAAAFLTGTSRTELSLAAVATALAVGTKVPALLGLPVLFLIALVARPKTRLSRLAAIAAGAVMGAYWYGVNVIETGQFFGRLLATSGEVGTGGFPKPPRQIVLHALAIAFDSFDLSGARGADLLVYAIVGATVATTFFLRSRRRSTLGPSWAPVAGALVLLPLALYPGSYAFWRLLAKAKYALGVPVGNLPLEGWPHPTHADETTSWFGPLGLLLVAGVGAAAVVLVLRRRLPPIAIVYAAAPLVWLALLSVGLGYDQWEGRLFMFPVALSASLWGLALRAPPVAWATVAVAATSAALTLVHYEQKPSGIRLLEGDVPASVWHMKRWEVQSLQRPEMRSALRFVEDRIPRSAPTALALGYNDFGYSVFGPTLERNIELVPVGSNGDELHAADWLVANASRAGAVDRTCWSVLFSDPESWTVFRRRTVACVG
jgi:hypothetical protein